MTLDDLLSEPLTPEDIAYGGEFKMSFQQKKMYNAGESEEALQLAVIVWLRCVYPHVVTNSSYLQGNFDSPGLMSKANAMGYTSGFPDIFIFEAKGGFHGLFLELKNGKKGVVSERQKTIINQLISKGYTGGVIRNLEDAKTLINNYMNLEPCKH